MRYDEKEELEATGEWLLRINTVGFSEDLMYVPSELTKMGVMPPPIDVVDRLHQLRVPDRMDRGIVEHVVEQPSAVMVLERPAVIDPILEMVSEVVPLVESTLVFDYDNFGPWEWAEPLEQMLENSIRAVFTPEPGLNVFNELVSLTHPPTTRVRGKRARSSGKSIA